MKGMSIFFKSLQTCCTDDHFVCVSVFSFSLHLMFQDECGQVLSAVRIAYIEETSTARWSTYTFFWYASSVTRRSCPRN
jgi:hypothetical protein